MYADPTMDAYARLRDESQWRIVRGVPIFKSFPKTKVMQGSQPVDIEVTDLDLYTICDNWNRRWTSTGTTGRITPGHIRPAEPEQYQPPVMGHPMYLRVGGYGPANELAILADFFVRPDQWDEFTKYPYRSPEYYHDRKEITGIALLVRDPKLDLGMLLFSGREGCFYFALDGAPDPTLSRTTCPNTVGPIDPTQPPSVESPMEEGRTASTHLDEPRVGPPDVPADWHKHFMACMSHEYPHMGDMHKHWHETKLTPRTEPVPMSQQTASPPATVAQAVAAPAPASPSPPAPTPESEALRMAREQQAAQFARQEQAITELRAALATEQQLRVRADVERSLVRFETLHPGIQFDMATEVGRMVPMNQDQQTAHFAYMDKYYGRDAGLALTHEAHQEFVGTSPSPSMFGTTGWPEDEFQEKDGPVAHAYLQKYPSKSWEEARQHAIDTRRGKKTA